MKKLISIIIVTVFSIISVIGIDGADNEVALCNKNTLENNENSSVIILKRSECLSRIMASIGYKEQQHFISDYEGFCDWSSNEGGWFVDFALFSRITYGEIQSIRPRSTYRSRHMDIDWDYFFCGDRDITVKEAVAFMIRCLEDDSSNKDLDICFEKAYTYGLIDHSETFDGNEPVTEELFAVLHERFLGQKRYKYYDEKSSSDLRRALIDDDRSITYREYAEICTTAKENEES